MKFLKSLFSISLVIIIFSCSSDDGETIPVNNTLVVGTWNLTQVNISLPQDPNEDGTSSTNMVDELPCLTGVLTINANNTWNLNLTDLNITPVTGDFYAVQCASSFSYSGNYIFQNNQLNLNDVNFTNLALNGTVLTETRGESLPGVLSYVYEKQ